MLIPTDYRGARLRIFEQIWLEAEVWKRIEEIMNDPNKLLLVIKDSIENLRRAEADLSERIRPIDERLAEIAAQKKPASGRLDYA